MFVLHNSHQSGTAASKQYNYNLRLFLAMMIHCCFSAGLFGFPSKEVQYRFLSQFKPVFYIRQREYAKVASP